MCHTSVSEARRGPLPRCLQGLPSCVTSRKRAEPVSLGVVQGLLARSPQAGFLDWPLGYLVLDSVCVSIIALLTVEKK